MLNRQELIRTVPSVANTARFENLTAKYNVFSTLDVVDALQEQGWFPVRAQQSRTRMEERRPFVKHQINFRNDDRRLSKGDVIAELVLINDHMGGTSWTFQGSMYRCWCDNQAVCPDSILQAFKARHVGHSMDDVIDGVYTVVEDLPKVIEKAEEYKGIIVPKDAQRVFATSAWALKYDPEDPNSPAAPVAQLLAPRRFADAGDDLWRVYNRVQENLIKGGVTATKQGAKRVSRTRKVGSIDESARLNKALWMLAEGLKGHLN